VCIYCNYKEQNQTASNLIASLLRQLAEDDSATYDNVKSLYERHKDGKTPLTFDETRKALQSEIDTYSKMFIIVDALDESSEADGTRGKLLTVLRSLGSTVSLLVTSRTHASIEEAFYGTQRLEIRARDQDVRRYIEGRIPQASRLSIHVRGDQALQEEIVTGIIQKVDGM
jgi:hypothetical protein